MNNQRINLIDGFTLDLARGCLVQDGKPVHLRPQSYEVLKYLVENKGYLVSKDRLIEEVWRGRAVTDGSLGKCIEEVREALGENSKNYLRNVRGRGYIFDLGTKERNVTEARLRPSEQIDVARVLSEHEQKEVNRINEGVGTAVSPSAPGACSGVERRSGRQMAITATVLSVVILASVIGYRFFTGRSPDSAPIKSIAVLPFQNESGNSDIEFLSEGVTESLINRLSQLPSVKVIARSSSFNYKGKDVDVQEVGRLLGVEGILMGRVLQRGDDLMISAELINVSDKTQVWGEKYQRHVSNVQTVPEEISLAISEQLRVELTGAQERQLTRRLTQNPRAYQLYLNGRFYFRKGGSENVLKGVEYFNQAVALDPNFALAWAAVANAYFGFAGTGLLNPNEALPKAKAAAHKALELDETLAEAHSVLASIKQDEWDWVEAERGHRRAIELNPNLENAHHRYARYLSVMGRHAEALTEVKSAQELDPLRLSLVLREGIILYLARRYDEAINKFQNVIELEPEHAQAHEYLALSYESKGMYEQAINEYDLAIKADKRRTDARIFLGYALAKLGRRGEARAILENLKNTKDYISPTMLAVLYVGLGDKEEAIAALERAHAARDLQLQYLKVVPHFDSLRSDERFQDLLRRVGFPL